MGSNLEVKHGGEKTGAWSRELGCYFVTSFSFICQSKNEGCSQCYWCVFDRIVLLLCSNWFDCIFWRVRYWCELIVPKLRQDIYFICDKKLKKWAPKLVYFFHWFNLLLFPYCEVPFIYGCFILSTYTMSQGDHNIVNHCWPFALHFANRNNQKYVCLYLALFQAEACWTVCKSKSPEKRNIFLEKRN